MPLDRRGGTRPVLPRPGAGGPENDRNTFMTWNPMQPTRLLKDAGRVPADENPPAGWDAFCRYAFPDSDY